MIHFNRRSLGRIPVILAALVAMMAADEPGCAPAPNGSTTSTGGANCHLWMSEAPQLYGEGHLAEIRASVRVTCQQRPAYHHLHATLEHDLRSDGHWLVQSAGLDEYLIPDSEGFQRTVIFGGCMTGPWRVKADVDGTDPGGKTHFTGTLVGQATTIRTCPGP